MGWFDKKGTEDDGPEGASDRSSLANVANPAEAPPQSPAARTGSSRPAPASGEDAPAADAPQASIFGETADIEGSIEGHGDVILRGTVRGSVHVTGALLIEPSGRVQADVAAREVVNAGTVEGNITAGERVRVAATGIVDGDIDAPCIVIDDGGGVEGFIQMEPPGGEDLDDDVDDFVPPPPVKGLRSSLPPKAPAAEPVRPAAASPSPAFATPPAAAKAPGPLTADRPSAPAPPEPGPSESERPGKGKGETTQEADRTLLSAPAFEPEPPDFDGPLGGRENKPSPSGP